MQSSEGHATPILGADKAAIDADRLHFAAERRKIRAKCGAAVPRIRVRAGILADGSENANGSGRNPPSPSSAHPPYEGAGSATLRTTKKEAPWPGTLFTPIRPP